MDMHLKVFGINLNLISIFLSLNLLEATIVQNITLQKPVLINYLKDISYYLEVDSHGIQMHYKVIPTQPVLEILQNLKEENFSEIFYIFLMKEKLLDMKLM